MVQAQTGTTQAFSGASGGLNGIEPLGVRPATNKNMVSNIVDHKTKPDVKPSVLKQYVGHTPTLITIDSGACDAVSLLVFSPIPLYMQIVKNVVRVMGPVGGKQFET